MTKRIESIVAERISCATVDGIVVGTEYRTFPIYDGHGDMIATPQRECSDTYSLGAEKRYNALGQVIASASTGSHVLIPNKVLCQFGGYPG